MLLSSPRSFFEDVLVRNIRIDQSRVKQRLVGSAGDVMRQLEALQPTQRFSVLRDVVCASLVCQSAT